MLKITVHRSTFDSINELKQKLHTVRRKLGHRNEAMRRIGDAEVKRWQVNFFSEGGIYEKWEPLSDTSRARYPNRLQTLLVTGRLFDNFVRQSEAFDINATAVQWDITNDPSGHYPLSHQYALGWNPTARKIWPATPGDLEKDRPIAERIMDTWIQEKIDEVF